MSRAGLAASITLILATSAAAASAARSSSPGSFTSRADRACAAAGAKVVALPVLTAANTVADLRSNATIVTKLVSRLKAIKPPAAKARRYAAFVALTQDQATIIGQLLSAIKANQTARIKQLNGQSDTVGKRSDRDARALGLTACAKGYAPSATTASTPATSGNAAGGSSS